MAITKIHLRLFFTHLLIILCVPELRANLDTDSVNAYLDRYLDAFYDGDRAQMILELDTRINNAPYDPSALALRVNYYTIFIEDASQLKNSSDQLRTFIQTEMASSIPDVNKLFLEPANKVLSGGYGPDSIVKDFPKPGTSKEEPSFYESYFVETARALAMRAIYPDRVNSENFEMEADASVVEVAGSADPVDEQTVKVLSADNTIQERPEQAKSDTKRKQPNYILIGVIALVVVSIAGYLLRKR